MIYAVTRRYTVEEVIFVEADSPTHARQQVEGGDWIDNTAAETVSSSTYRKASPRPDLEIRYGELVKRESGRAVVE